ncbi:hypothetical protein RCL_jg14583.t1 [Rhizophagus clarus]|uniref:Uncharacterized protein n=1 Tax=Rhizophagus clarus TaxID=94130 RepID=A0A8H3QY93_9GLOM|nr:hypothetical protein RCL_jg14583.t1 [Rhizophagus clarus]
MHNDDLLTINFSITADPITVKFGSVVSLYLNFIQKCSRSLWIDFIEGDLALGLFQREQRNGVDSETHFLIQTVNDKIKYLKLDCNLLARLTELAKSIVKKPILRRFHILDLSLAVRSKTE